MNGSSRREQIEQMLAAEPNDAFLLYALAMEQESAEELTEAVETLLKLRASTPEYVPTYLQLGQIYLKLERSSEAREAFTEGIEQARKVGDGHAEAEMTGMLEGIGE